MSRKRRALGAVSALAALALAGGVAAQFTTSTQSAPQSIGTGTLALSLDSVAPTEWTLPISNLAAGDSVERFVDLRNSGSLKISDITLSQTNTLGDLLTSPSDINVTLESCSVAWNTTTGACSGTQLIVLGQNSVRGWGSTAKNLNTFEAFGAGEVRHLKFSTGVEAGATNAVQSKSGTITYTFAGTQRAGGTWGSTSDATLPLNAPTGVSVTPQGNDFKVSWTDTNSGQVAYTVNRSTNGATSVSTVLNKGVTSYVFTGAEAGKTYDFSVLATAGAEAVSIPAPAITVLAAPALAVTQTGTTALRATITDNSAGKASYVLRYTPAGGATQSISLPAGTLTYDLSGLQLETAYTIEAVATSAGQTKSASVTSKLALNQPGSVALTATDKTMKIDFVDTNAGQAAYSVSYAPAAGGTPVVVNVPAGQLTTTISGLSANTSYAFTVTAAKSGKTASVSTTKSTSAPAGVSLDSGSWSTLTSVPSLVTHTTAQGVGNDIYVFGGANGNPTNIVQKYNTVANTWSNAAPMPSAVRSAVSAVGLNGKVYVFGGYDVTSVRDIVQQFDPETNTWVTKPAKMPVATNGAMAQTAPDGSIYVMGGVLDSGATSDVVQKYTPSTDTWTTVQKMNLGMYAAGSAVGADGNIYVFGGYNGSTTYSTVQKYTVSTNTWSGVTSMPATAGHTVAHVGPDGSFYVYNGISSNTPRSNVMKGVIGSDGSATWSYVTPTTWNRYAMATAKDASGRVYLIGGLKNGNWTKDVDRLG